MRAKTLLLIWVCTCLWFENIEPVSGYTQQDSISLGKNRMDSLLRNLTKQVGHNDQSLTRGTLTVITLEVWRSLAKDKANISRWKANQQVLEGADLTPETLKSSELYRNVLKICLSTINPGNQNGISQQQEEINTSFKEIEKHNSYGPIIRLIGDRLEKHNRPNLAEQFYLMAVEAYDLIGNRLEMANTYNCLGILKWTKSDYSASRKYNHKALEIAVDISNYPLIGRLYSNLGILFSVQGNFSEAISSYKKSLDIAIKTDDKKAQSGSLINIGNTYARRGMFPEALDHFTQSLELKVILKDSSGIAKLYNNIGSLYLELKKYDDAAANLKASLAIKLKLGNSRSTASTYRSLGELYLEMNKLDSVRFYLGESLRLANQINDPGSIASAFTSLGKLAFEQNQFAVSSDYYQRSLQIYTTIGSKRGIVKCLIPMGQLALERSSYHLAEEYLLKAYHISSEINAQEQLLEALSNMVKLYANLNQFDKAFTYHEQYDALNDSMHNKQKALEIARIEMRADFGKKELEISLLNEKKRQQAKWLIGGIIFVVVVALLIGLMLYNRLKMSRQMLVNEKQLDQLKTDFFTNISHEQRTPLTLIAGSLGQLLKGDQTKTADRNKLHRAIGQTKLLIKMADQIMDLSKLEDKRIELFPAPVNLHRLLKHLFAAFDSAAAIKHISYNFNFLIDKEIWVNLDTDRFSTIISNLIGNAIKYTQEGGEINLIADETIISRQLKIIVKDNGRGIREEDRSRIFDRYFQSSATDSAPQGGVGIGLALVGELVKLFGGEIKLRSKLGEGSAFIVILPIEKVEPDPGREATAYDEGYDYSEHVHSLNEKYIGKTEAAATVLIAEDNPDMRDYLKDIMEPYYCLKFATDGKKAFDLLKEPNAKIDLLITDAMMPALDGFSLLERLRTNEQFYGLPVLMLTARTEDKDRIRALQLGVDDYMTKPFSETELLVRTENLLQRRQSRIDFAKTDDENEMELESFSPDLQMLKRIEEIIRQQLANAQFSVQDLSEVLGMSRRTVLRKVKRITGLSPNEYFREIRLIEAREKFMLGTYQSVSEVCYAVGFDSPGYFSKMYIKRFGKKPSSYLYEEID